MLKKLKKRYSGEKSGFEAENIIQIITEDRVYESAYFTGSRTENTTTRFTGI